MPAAHRRSLLPAALGASALAYLCHQAGPSFAAQRQPSRVNGRTAVRGFKEDFDAWRSTLTPEEKSLVANQAKGEFNKKFRKSEEFSKDLPEDKMKAFGEVVSKFFDAEVDDYKKEVKTRGNDPDGLFFKGAAGGGSDYVMTKCISEIDRDAERRWQFVQQRSRQAAIDGTTFFSASPKLDQYDIKNDDEASHAFNVKLAEKSDGKIKVPPMGERFILVLPRAVEKILTDMSNDFAKFEAEADDSMKAKLESMRKDGTLYGASLMLFKHVYDEWGKAKAEVEEDVEWIKKYYGSAKDEMKQQSKADLLKALWKTMGEQNPKMDLPALDSDLLADLAKVPAVLEGEFKHPWGTAKQLWKSEAVDSFRNKYLLGVYETKEEASKAFDEWYVEYEKATADQVEEMEQWGKKEQARIDSDGQYQDQSKRVLETAKAMLEKDLESKR